MKARESAVEIIAHRGASFDAPENTVASALLGWSQGADAVEVDVRESAAGLVVIHDDTIERTTGRRGRVAFLTPDELARADAGSWKGERFAGERIPRLRELLDAMPDGARLVIEIKTGSPARLREELEGSGRPAGSFTVIAFDPAIAAGAKRELPACRVFRLALHDPHDPALGLEALIREAREDGLDGLNLSRKWPIDAAVVHAVRGAGLALFVWTVDDPEEARRLVAAGVDGITTNRPGWLRAQLGGGPRPAGAGLV